MKQDNSVSVIEDLLAKNTDATITYAALECRLVIERICYERLRISHDYISNDDLKKWRPKDIVNIVASEMNEDVTKDFVLHISTRPFLEEIDNPSAEDYEKFEYVPVGRHIGLNPAKLGKLWQALSNLALHTPLPKSKDDQINCYGETGLIRSKVIEALDEIKRIYSGSLITSGMGEEITFHCVCGKKIKRRSGLLTAKKVISCSDDACNESYEFDGVDSLVRRIFDAHCRHCSQTTHVHRKLLDGLSRGKSVQINCQNTECGEALTFACTVVLGQADSSSRPAQPVD